MTRKLDGVSKDLTLLAEQGRVVGFLNNVENASKLGGLLEEIRDATMEYQVCMLLDYFVLQRLMFKLGFTTTRYL